MVECRKDTLVFRFPEVSPKAQLTIEFQRTLRIPDDGKEYPLPAGLGRFALRHVEDHAKTAPADWLRRGGVMMPMYQSEALWIRFSSDYLADHDTSYPFAVKIAAGKIDAVSGKPWSNELHREPQDYVVSPGQPWLDGFCVEKGVIRQFVAMPLGCGYSAEEQITGEAEWGGLQIAVYPMRRDEFERRFPRGRRRKRMLYRMSAVACAAAPSMGLAPGGRMRQHIHEDEFGLDVWETEARSRCFVHLCNSMAWRAITNANPPHPPPTAAEYKRGGLPWFSYYDEGAVALEGSPILAKLKGIFQMSQEKQDGAFPTNEKVEVDKVHVLRGPKGGVKDGQW